MGKGQELSASRLASQSVAGATHLSVSDRQSLLLFRARSRIQVTCCPSLNSMSCETHVCRSYFARICSLLASFWIPVTCLMGLRAFLVVSLHMQRLAQTSLNSDSSHAHNKPYVMLYTSWIFHRFFHSFFSLIDWPQWPLLLFKWFSSATKTIH